MFFWGISFLSSSVHTNPKRGSMFIFQVQEGAKTTKTDAVGYNRWFLGESWKTESMKAFKTVYKSDLLKMGVTESASCKLTVSTKNGTTFLKFEDKATKSTYEFARTAAGFYARRGTNSLELKDFEKDLTNVEAVALVKITQLCLGVVADGKFGSGTLKAFLNSKDNGIKKALADNADLSCPVPAQNAWNSLDYFFSSKNGVANVQKDKRQMVAETILKNYSPDVKDVKVENFPASLSWAVDAAAPNGSDIIMKYDASNGLYSKNFFLATVEYQVQHGLAVDGLINGETTAFINKEVILNSRPGRTV
jgi:murein L,D-transpeptidase YcbB/YkuD